VHPVLRGGLGFPSASRSGIARKGRWMVEKRSIGCRDFVVYSVKLGLGRDG